ncbi:MAG: TonB family protein [Ekhidna sp.]
MKKSKNAELASLHQETIHELSKANKRIVRQNKNLTLCESLIEIKKERKRRELALRPLLLNVGMVLSLLFAILAINWKSYNDGELIDLGRVVVGLNEVVEIPTSKQPPPPPPKQEIFQIEEVKDTEIIEDINVDLDVEVTENEAVEEVEVSMEVEEEQVEEVFVIVEQEPMPQGGFEAFYAYLADELRYPAQALRLDISGSVFVQFIIEKDGRITGVQLVKGIGAGCDEEALRVIKSAPPWVPGKQRGVAVRVKKIIPVRFVIGKR